MAVRTTRRRLQTYLDALHAAPEFLGVRDFHRRFARHLGHERTLARWRQKLRTTLRAFPSFTTEALGLAHVHLVVVCPDARWPSFPYAVELVWATPDLARRALYLHCLIPTSHVSGVLELVRSLREQGWCTDLAVFPSQSGSQHLRSCGHQSSGEEYRAVEQRSLLQRHPLVVPVVAESWNRDASLPGLWRIIHERLGVAVRAYLPHRRLLIVNGKQHVRTACQALVDAGLFRQQVIRSAAPGDELLELLLVGVAAGDGLVELIAALRHVATMIETYWSTDGRVLVRVAGPMGVLNLILDTVTGSLAAPLLFVVDGERTRRSPTGRFCYEFLFDPKAGAWVFPPDRIMKHLSAR